jgi:hypothetical protein
MLDFFPRLLPWAYITDSMTAELPVGNFYLSSMDERVPRSSKPTEFTLVTDRNDPVKIVINNTLMGTVIPKTYMQPVYINLFDPPALNYITADNGVDEPVHFAVASTYMNSILELSAREIYSYAGRQIEKYTNLLSSRWASFLVEYQLPWRRYLPDVRSYRILAIKAMARSMFADGGTESATRDFLGAFACSTPVLKESRNPAEWQPDLYQPVTAAEDVYGFEGHIWVPNLCLGRWVAFNKLVNNVDAFYRFAIAGEDVVTVTPVGTTAYEAHIFNTLDHGCSIRSLLEFLGCLDNIAVVCSVDIYSDVPICAYATPFDQTVEHPGIGGEFFDSDDTLDTAAHEQPDVVNVVTAPDAIDGASAIVLATDIHTVFNAHDIDPTPVWHFVAGGSHQITAAIPFDLPTLITFCIDAQTAYANHINDAAMHTHPDVDRALAYTIIITSTIGEIVLFLNDMKSKLSEHQAIGNLDGIYDIDLLTDYWVGTSTKKMFDYGKCLDTYPTFGKPAPDVNCCIDGPDTLEFSTMACYDEVLSAHTPNHPIFGGDTPGLLDNPYFDVLA